MDVNLGTGVNRRWRQRQAVVAGNALAQQSPAIRLVEAGGGSRARTSISARAVGATAPDLAQLLSCGQIPGICAPDSCWARAQSGRSFFHGYRAASTAPKPTAEKTRRRWSFECSSFREVPGQAETVRAQLVGFDSGITCNGWNRAWSLAR